jgi:hypothetical protein
MQSCYTCTLNMDDDFSYVNNLQLLQVFDLNNHMQAVNILNSVFTLNNMQMSSNIDSEK